MRATASFDVTGWDQTPISEPDERPFHSRAIVKKSFRGDLEAESTAELLMCQSDPEDHGAGAGYVASEVVTGTLAGRAGTFVMQHVGVSDRTGARTSGSIVPGSGSGELEGLSGTLEISVDSDGAHSITIDYEIG